MAVSGGASSSVGARHRSLSAVARQAIYVVEDCRCLDAKSARRLVDFRVGRSMQERIDRLGERANEGSLSADERDEYEALIDAADFISILKLKARRHPGQIPQ